MFNVICYIISLNITKVHFIVNLHYGGIANTMKKMR